MKWIWLIFLLSSATLWAQESETNGNSPEEPDSPPAETSEVEAISVEALRQADTKINEEREALAKQRRRLEMLVEDLKNQATAIDSKESQIMQALNDQRQNQQEPTIPDVQVAHWESRDPVIAANDFVLLYREEPGVAVALIKKMKKKKSARLIDQVSQLQDDGKEIAARLHEAIGTGRLRASNGTQ